MKFKTAKELSKMSVEENAAYITELQNEVTESNKTGEELKKITAQLSAKLKTKEASGSDRETVELDEVNYLIRLASANINGRVIKITAEELLKNKKLVTEILEIKGQNILIALDTKKK